MDDARQAIHAALTAVLAMSAVILALPYDTLGSSSSFSVMAALASEGTWAMLMAACTVVGIVGLVTRRRLTRLASVLVLATMHGVLGFTFLAGNPKGIAIAAFMPWAGLGYYLAWRRAREGL